MQSRRSWSRERAELATHLMCKISGICDNRPISVQFRNKIIYTKFNHEKQSAHTLSVRLSSLSAF